ncbi:hypothetical protein GQR58_029633 [Nymphon striatum]|nr:hypothetical protein GQR58_029633 [Nymphon striatum]
MRARSDGNLSSPKFKQRSVHELTGRGFIPQLAIDDDQRNVDMFRDEGINTLYLHSGYYEACHTRDPLSVAIVGSADIANGKDLVAASNAEIRTDDDATGSIGIWSKVGAERLLHPIRERWQDGRARFDEQDLAGRGVDPSEVAPQGLGGDFLDRSGHLHAGWPRTHDDEGHDNGSAIRQHDGDRRQQDIDDNADAQGPGDGSRCDPLGVACLFGHVRNVFEANEREEGHDRSGQDRAEDRGIVGLEHQAGQLRVAKLRKPVRRHDNKRADLDECHCCGEPHTFAHTRRCDRQHERHDDYRGNDVVDSGQRADITAEGERHDCAGDGARNNDTQPGNASKAWAKPSGDVHRLAASLREAAHELHVGQPRDACDRPGDQECQWRLVTGYAKDLTDERKDSCADGYPDAIEDQERKGQGPA